MKKSVHFFRTLCSTAFFLSCVTLFLLYATDTYSQGHLAAPWLYTQVFSSITLLMSAWLGELYARSYIKSKFTVMIQLIVVYWLYSSLNYFYDVATFEYKVVHEPQFSDYLATVISHTITVSSIISTTLFLIYSSLRNRVNR